MQKRRQKINFDSALYQHQQEVKGRLSNASSLEIGCSIFKSMVFLDVHRTTTVRQATFSSMLLKYSSAKPMRECHKIKSLRQGLYAMWRHFVASLITEQRNQPRNCAGVGALCGSGCCRVCV